jgi:hypothetical protein
MMIQQNAIASTVQPIEVRKNRIKNTNTLLAVLLILGATLMFSLYVYQASVIFSTEMAIKNKQMEYARQERLNAESLVMLAQTQSMESMVRRAEASGYQPPETKQVKYVFMRNGKPIFAQNASVSINR